MGGWMRLTSRNTRKQKGCCAIQLFEQTWLGSFRRDQGVSQDPGLLLFLAGFPAVYSFVLSLIPFQRKNEGRLPFAMVIWYPRNLQVCMQLSCLYMTALDQEQFNILRFICSCIWAFMRPDLHFLFFASEHCPNLWSAPSCRNLLLTYCAEDQYQEERKKFSHVWPLPHAGCAAPRGRRRAQPVKSPIPIVAPVAFPAC